MGSKHETNDQRLWTWPITTKAVDVLFWTLVTSSTTKYVVLSTLSSSTRREAILRRAQPPGSPGREITRKDCWCGIDIGLGGLNRGIGRRWLALEPMHPSTTDLTMDESMTWAIHV
jgi:hypothetical protein